MGWMGFPELHAEPAVADDPRWRLRMVPAMWRVAAGCRLR